MNRCLKKEDPATQQVPERGPDNLKSAMDSSSSSSRGRRHMHVYENSEAFLKRLSSSADPFGADFEKSLEDAPVVEAAAAASEALSRQVCSRL